ncbi:MAG: FkbM family methyltransferase [Pseudomonadota bacterium]
MISDALTQALTDGSVTHGRPFNQHSNGVLVGLFNAFLEDHGIDTLIELGAHRASTARRFMRAKRGRRALAVEANPFNHAKFKEQVEARGVVYWNLAVNDVTGPVDLILADDQVDRARGHTKTSNSLLRNKDHGRTMTRTVEGLSFDDLIARAVGEGVLAAPAQAKTALWIDLEGIVDRMLAGGKTHLPSCQAIFVEVEHAELFEGQMAYPQVNAMFEELGFTAVLRDNEYYPRQNNVLYVSRDAMSADEMAAWQDRLLAALATFEPDAATQ